MFNNINPVVKNVSGLGILCSNILNNFELFKINISKYLFKYIGEYDKYMGNMAIQCSTYMSMYMYMCV